MLLFGLGSSCLLLRRLGGARAGLPGGLFAVYPNSAPELPEAAGKPAAAPPERQHPLNGVRAAEAREEEREQGQLLSLLLGEGWSEPRGGELGVFLSCRKGQAGPL